MEQNHDLLEWIEINIGECRTNQLLTILKSIIYALSSKQKV